TVGIRAQRPMSHGCRLHVQADASKRSASIGRTFHRDGQPFFSGVDAAVHSHRHALYRDSRALPWSRRHIQDYRQLLARLATRLAHDRDDRRVSFPSASTSRERHPGGRDRGHRGGSVTTKSAHANDAQPSWLARRRDWIATIGILVTFSVIYSIS